MRCAALTESGAIAGSNSAVVRCVYFTTSGATGGTVKVSDADAEGEPLPRVALEVAAPLAAGAWVVVQLGGGGFVAGQGVHVAMSGDVASVSVFLD